MANDGSIVFEVQIDKKNVKTDLKDITKDIKTETKKWDDSAKSAASNTEADAKTSADAIGAIFDGMAAGLGAAFVQITVQFLQELGKWVAASIDVAADVEQINKVMDVTFGEGAKQVDSWAKAAGDRFGMTELQAKKYAATLGSMAKAAGLSGEESAKLATDLTGLAADLATLYGIDFDTAFDKIKSGLGGSGKALQEMGISLTKETMQKYMDDLGWGKWQDVSDANKMLKLYEQIMKQSSDAQGEYARTAEENYDSLKKESDVLMENAQATVGEWLLPFAKDFERSKNAIFRFITGNDGVVISGSKDNITKRLEEQQAAADQAKVKMEELAESYAEMFDLDPEDYNENLYSSFGEFFYEFMRTRQLTTSGKERERIDAILAEMAPFYQQFGDAESKVSDLQAQLDKLAKQDAEQNQDAKQKGAAVAGALVDGVESQQAALNSAVNSLNSELGRIGDVGYGGYTPYVDGSHAGGLRYVPFNGYVARLHEGEAVLTAQENRLWQRFRAGAGNGIDYDTMGGVMRDNIKAGGNVYLDGRVVGSVISDQQGRSYRQLQRSGWQA